jgi:hypothetical protein
LCYPKPPIVGVFSKPALLQNNPMTSELLSLDTLSKAFVTALLLTGSVELAESAVSENAMLLDCDEPSVEALLQGVAESSIPPRGQNTVPRQTELERASSLLPFELRRVLHLAPDLRNCFVLRVLGGLSREVCARVLQLDIHQIDNDTCSAMLALPFVQESAVPTC